MLKKYNIALLPKSESEEITKLSQSFSSIAGEYLLGEESLPHVTLCQFSAEESDVDRIWGEVCAALAKNFIELSFSEIGSITIDGYDWISLLPDSNPALLKMHYTVANIIKSPLSRSFENYDPHITLINTKQDKEKKHRALIEKSLGPISPIKDTFSIALGECDKIGQFTKIIHHPEVNEKITCKL